MPKWGGGGKRKTERKATLIQTGKSQSTVAVPIEAPRLQGGSWGSDRSRGETHPERWSRDPGRKEWAEKPKDAEGA